MDREVRLVAFDLLAVGGVDIRPDLLHAPKARLTKLLAKSGDGIQINEYLQGDIGPKMFEHVWHHLQAPGSRLSSGWSRHWIKVKNPNSPAMVRVEDGLW
jgi:ATP-dependent DNA ligase